MAEDSEDDLLNDDFDPYDYEEWNEDEIEEEEEEDIYDGIDE